MSVLSIEERDHLLLRWKNAKETLEIAKEAEMALRNRIVLESGLFDPNKEEGTETVGLGEGWKIKAVKKINYSIANSNGEAFEVLAQLDKIGPVESHLAKELFRFEANMRIAKYKELAGVNAEAYKLVESIVTTKPGSPSLELVAPKAKK